MMPRIKEVESNQFTCHKEEMNGGLGRLRWKSGRQVLWNCLLLRSPASKSMRCPEIQKEIYGFGPKDKALHTKSTGGDSSFFPYLLTRSN